MDRAGRAPLIGDLNDPVSLGVHPAASAVQEGVVTKTPPFIARDVMPQVLDVLTGSRFLLLVGDSTAGKSRAAFEAVRRSFPGYRIVEPAGRRAAVAAADFAASTPRCVLWLDDLERFLGTGGLTGQAVSRVLDAPGRCVIAATMRSEEYARFSGSGPADLPGLGREAMRSGMDVIIAFRSGDYHGREAEPFPAASRLLYVALTRARTQVTLILPTDPHMLVAPFASLVRAPHAPS